MKTSAELRFFSRQRLNGYYGTTIAVTATLLAAELILSFVIQRLVRPTDGLGPFVAYEAAVFLVDLLLGVLISGQALLYMNIIYGRQASFTGDLKQGFLEHPEKAVLLRLPFALAATLSTAPVNYYQLFYFGRSQDRDTLFVLLLLSTMGLAIELVLELVYAQVLYLLHDFPERSVSELFSASARLMQGHKGQYFLLLASYIPWFFASAFLFFIPALFIYSQMNAAQAAFYQSLVAARRLSDTPTRSPWNRA